MGSSKQIWPKMQIFVRLKASFASTLQWLCEGKVHWAACEAGSCYVKVLVGDFNSCCWCFKGNISYAYISLVCLKVCSTPEIGWRSWLTFILSRLVEATNQGLLLIRGPKFQRYLGGTGQEAERKRRRWIDNSCQVVPVTSVYGSSWKCRLQNMMLFGWVAVDGPVSKMCYIMLHQWSKI